jgi:hypothetical protein
MIKAINGFTPNGNISNAIAEFWQNTAPAQRIDGTPLVIGDLWKKAGQEQAEWDGTNWISPFKYLSASSTAVATNSYFLPVAVPFLVTSDTPIANIKIIYQRFFTGIAGATLDATNNWSIEPRYRSISGSDVSLAATFLYNNTSFSGRYQLLVSGLVVPVSTLSTIQVALTRNSAPSTGIFSHQLCYSHILG